MCFRLGEKFEVRIEVDVIRPWLSVKLNRRGFGTGHKIQPEIVSSHNHCSMNLNVKSISFLCYLGCTRPGPSEI